MLVQRIFAMYFSPTGTTKKAVTAVAAGCAKRLALPWKTIDFTLPLAREGSYDFTENDLVIFGVPVYAGRVPNVLLKFLTEKLSGNGAYVIPVVLFGNRNFDDALLELHGILKKEGFRPLAAGAFVGEHSFSYHLGKGRPNREDYEDMDILAARAVGRLSEDSLPTLFPDTPPTPYYTPRDRHGKYSKGKAQNGLFLFWLWKMRKTLSHGLHFPGGSQNRLRYLY